jgi:thiol-disulfide isomerase/thioredoxin
LSDHRGELVFLNFWATWCPPCREEMPAMDVMNDALSDVPFEMLALNVQEGRDQVSQFIGDIGTDFPILFDRSGRIASNYGVRGLPSTYFISPAGNVLGVLVGTRLWDEPAILDTIREAAELASDEDA